MATASESSSAMLDLNDADTEDTDAPSVTDDVRDAVPLIMEHGYDIAVKVDAPMKQLSTLETFVTYRVRCVCARWPAPPLVRRRYNHFKQLHKRLCASHPWLAPPPLPPLHTARQQLDRYSPSFVHIRTMALHAFLDRVAKHPIFTHSEDFRIFLTTPDEEIDKVFKSESGAMNLWGLSSALYSTSENKPTNGARVKDPEWTSYAEYLTALQHKLTTLCTLTTKLHKGTISLSNEMITMKRTCSSWSSQARGDTAVAAAAIARSLPAAPHAAPPTARALLPLLCSYTAAHLDKIKQRDQLHAAYVAGASATGEAHNKLEQATECLRSELADWLPKTRSDVTGLLLELARTQLHWHTQIYQSWENALKLSKETNPEDIFKTVSLAGVSLLSPSRARAFQTPGVSQTPGESHTPGVSQTDGVSHTQPGTQTEELEELDNYSNSTDCDEVLDSRTSQWNGQETNHTEIKQGVPESEALSIQGVIQAQDKEEFLNEILDEDKKDTNSMGKSSKSDVVSDPLRDFSDPLRDSRDFAEVDLGDID